MAIFTLTIELGNEVMQTPSDVAHVLYEAAELIDLRDYMGQRPIFDTNGNRVGQWSVTE